MPKAYFIATLLFTATFSAQANTLEVGTYYTSDGSSSAYLHVKKENNKLVFELSAGGRNGSNCILEGYVKGNTLESEFCSIPLKLTKDGFIIPNNGEANGCALCGVGANIEGKYVKMPEECLYDNLEKANKQSGNLVKNKQYKQAENMLASLLQKCEGKMSEYQSLWLRSDLAFTYYKMNQKQRCLEVLKPAQEFIKYPLNKHPKIHFNDADFYEPLYKALKHNTKLCSK